MWHSTENALRPLYTWFCFPFQCDGYYTSICYIYALIYLYIFCSLLSAWRRLRLFGALQRRRKKNYIKCKYYTLLMYMHVYRVFDWIRYNTTRRYPYHLHFEPNNVCTHIESDVCVCVRHNKAIVKRYLLNLFFLCSFCFRLFQRQKYTNLLLLLLLPFYFNPKVFDLFELLRSMHIN